MFIEEIYRTIDRVFQKNLPKSIFVDKYFFRYFHDLAQSFNLQESLCEKIRLAMIQLQE